VLSAHGADYQSWSDITTIYSFADRWRYDGDQGIRWGEQNDSDWMLLYVRPSVRYRVKPWFTVHGGIRFFQTFIDDEEDTFGIAPGRAFDSSGRRLETTSSIITCAWKNA